MGIAPGKPMEYREDDESWKQDFFIRFKAGGSIPKGFRKMSHMETDTISRGGKVIRESEMQAYHNYQSHEKSISYYANGRRQQKEESVFRRGYEKNQRTLYSENESGSISEKQKTIARPPINELDDLLGTLLKKEIIKYDLNGTMASKIRVSERGGVSAITEYDKDGDRKRKTVTIRSDDRSDAKTFKIVKEYDKNDRSVKRTVTEDGKETDKYDRPDLLFTIEKSEEVTLDGIYGLGVVGLRKISVSYDDDGKARLVKDMYYDIDGDTYYISDSCASSCVSYTTEKDGTFIINRMEDGETKDVTICSSSGEYKQERPLCETEHVKVFILEGNAEKCPSLHKDETSEMMPVAVAYDITKGSVIINVREGSGLNAADIAKRLWGEEAVGDEITAYSPKDMEIEPVDMLDAVEMAETAVEPAETIKRVEELGQIRAYAMGELRGCLVEAKKEMPEKESR